MDSLERRDVFKMLFGAAGLLLLTRRAQASEWTSTRPYVALQQKVPLIQIADRPVILETPRHYFLHAITPNPAFFVRWHLDGHPTRVDLQNWRLKLGGHVETPLELSYDALLKFEPVSVTAVNQCSGNSRSRFSPAVPGAQWGNGGMGCGVWTGVRLRDVLARVRPKAGAQRVQFEGMDRGKGPPGKGSYSYMKSVAMGQEAILAYAMNGEPLPLLNGFPLRLVVPGYFSTYWVKALESVRVLDGPDENYWMNTAYQVPNNARGHVAPGQAQFDKVPIGKLVVRSFIVTPDGSGKIPLGFPLTVRGIALGVDGVKAVEFSDDDGKTWSNATLGENLGPYAFRTWEKRWAPKRAGAHVLAVRATDGSGNRQTDEAVWNPGGYMWNRIERQDVMVGAV